MTEASGAVDEAWRVHSRRVLATLIRLLGDFDLAEEALHDAFAAAAARWPEEGVPAYPSSWLVSAGRFRAIDRLRRRARFDAAEADLVRQIEERQEEADAMEDHDIADDRLRLIFTCCHPALTPEGRVALTLRELCGLTTEEIARAFLMRAPALAQRIVRAKATIRDRAIPYAVPERDEMPARLDAVLRVLYLVFNEGYSAHSGADLVRTDLSGEAIRLCRLVVDLVPDGEAFGLLALMIFHESRRTARATPDGDVILLADQDRTLWDPALIAEASRLVERAFATRDVGPYTIQAAIAAVHAGAKTAAETDWPRIVTLYDVLMQASPSPVVELNRAVAVGMADGPEAGLAIVERLLARGDLSAYHPAYAALADFNRRLERVEQAIAAYQKAMSLCRMEPELRFFQRRIAELSDSPDLSLSQCGPAPE